MFGLSKTANSIEGKDVNTSTARKAFNDWPNDAGFDATIEQRDPVELDVRGFIPPEVAGVLYRTGPSQCRIKDTSKGEYAVSHMFDGFTHVHRFQIISDPDGSCKVLHNSRRQVTALLNNIRKTGKLDAITFAQKRDPNMTFLQKMKASLEPFSGSQVPGGNNPDWANVGVTIHSSVPGYTKADDCISNLVAFTDSDTAKQINPETLEPIVLRQQKEYHPDLTGPISCAHVQIDPVNGDLYNYNLEFGATATYRFFRTLQSTGETEILATLSGSGIAAAYVHSFFLTTDFVILCLWPSFFAAAGAKILWERSLLDAMSKFDSRKDTRWLVVDRKHNRGHIATFISPAMFSYHTVNAWQEESSAGNGKVDIICDLIQYPNLDNLHGLYYESIVSTCPNSWNKDYTKPSTVRPSMTRYRLSNVSNDPTSSPTGHQNNPAQVSLLFTLPSPLSGEFPTINPTFRTKPTHYTYSLLDRGHSSYFDGIVKTNLDNKSTLIWECAKHTPSEALFVPDPSRDGEEDAGWLLSVVLDGEKERSYLLVLDAQTMVEVGRAESRDAVGFGFHGVFIPRKV